MSEGSDGALVLAPRSTPPAPKRGGLAVRFGTRAISSLVKNGPARRVALVGAAFGVGYQLSRMSRSGGLPRFADDLKDIYRAANGDVGAEGRLVGGWVRESITIVSAAYKFLDKDDAS
ncbi:MAG: hypothetical protein O3B65_07075 [Chloroflexi bacterium]|nr:hypothetical protein [Chloroflexota bacterium]